MLNKITGKIISTFIRVMIPFTVWMGKIKMPFTSKVMVFSRYYEIEKCLEVGDVILTTTYGELSNLFNPGEWKHALTYIGKIKGIPTIIEAIGQGVVQRSLIEMLADKDQIVVLSPEDCVLNQEQRLVAVNWLKKQLGKPYDYGFSMQGRNALKNFYCSEAVYESQKFANPNTTFILREKWGVLSVSPSDFYNAVSKGKFKIKIEVRKEKNKKL